MTEIDPIELAAELIRRPSVTPRDEGALDIVASRLEQLGFVCHRLVFDDPGPDGEETAPIANLYARFGDGRPNLCFAGHTDVVPTGPVEGWSFEPFAASLRDGELCGRGAVDMKGAIAAFIAAAERFLAARGDGFAGSISLLITGDEEGVAVNGTKKVLEWLRTARRGHRCLRRRRADLGRCARRHDQDRKARQHDRAADRRGRAGPCRLSAPRR